MLTSLLEANSGDQERVLLEEILDHNRGRILSRLRSKHAKLSQKSRGRPCLVTRLAEAFSATKSAFSIPVEVQTSVKDLKSAFERLEALPRARAWSGLGTVILADVLRSAHNIASWVDLESFLQSIPNSGNFNSESSASLYIATGKLGRYYSTCRFLIVAAQKLSIFKSIRVEEAHLPKSALLASSMAQSKTTLASTLKRIFPGELPREVKILSKSLKQKSGIADVSTDARFYEHLKSCQSRRKVHAEIQLVFHYELNSAEKCPRVICSSKSACFLCNVFVQLHGTFYMARTHGVLYEKWMIPNIRKADLSGAQADKIAKVVRRLNETLEGKIRSTLSKPSMRRFHPNESVFIEPHIWTPSTVSLGVVTNALPTSQVEIFEKTLTSRSKLSNVVHVTESSAVMDPLQCDSYPAGRLGMSRQSLMEPSIPTSAATSQRSLKPGYQEAFSGTGVSHEIVESSLTALTTGDEPLEDSPSLAKSSQDNTVLAVQKSFEGMQAGSRATSIDNLESSIADSAGCITLTPPLPAAKIGVQRTSYELLTKGQSTLRKLTVVSPYAKFSTKHIRLTLSFDPPGSLPEKATTAPEGKSKETFDSGEQVHVVVRWLGHHEEPERCDEKGPKIVNLDTAAEKEESIFSYGATRSLAMLYIARKADIVGIKYMP